MTNKIDILISERDYRKLSDHLFPGDGDEHGAILTAGIVEAGDRTRLLVREVILAREGIDYVPGQFGYRALTPKFIHSQITRCRDERLAYVAVHNHDAEDRVEFSKIDLESHERGYPALLDIAKGMPVGAVVVGRHSAQADIWLPGRKRMKLEELKVIGCGVQRLKPSPEKAIGSPEEFDRQVRFLGDLGQTILKRSSVAVVGLGGIGSIVAEYLARLGVGEFFLVDPDRIEKTNLSRVVGANESDVQANLLKVRIAARQIHSFNREIVVHEVPEDVVSCEVAKRLRFCDYIFLAADSMRARLVVNALAHQYLIPTVQLGAKIRADSFGTIEDAMSVVRPIRPGTSCLWCNQLIDPTILAIESKTDKERADQAYGTRIPNPSVITLNAVAAANAVNEFLFDFLGLRPGKEVPQFLHYHFTKSQNQFVTPRSDPDCSECSRDSGRYGWGDGKSLPCI